MFYAVPITQDADEEMTIAAAFASERADRITVLRRFELNYTVLASI